jgi:hypothetical protein
MGDEVGIERRVLRTQRANQDARAVAQLLVMLGEMRVRVLRGSSLISWFRLP